MTFSRPPTMMVTLGLPPSPVWTSCEPRQAVVAAATRVSAASAPAIRRILIDSFLSDDGLAAGSGHRGPPPQQPAFEVSDAPLGEQCDDGDDDHRGVDARGVERALRVRNQEADARLGSGVLADDRADQ